ncbi:MAG: site-specific integrase [Bacteroidetes bacterium]|nr:site-specific integrase [Bacteroidota bacterium]
MKATFTPVFNRKKKLNANEKALVEIRMYQNRTRRFISTGILIKPEHWDSKNQEVNKKHPDAGLLNFQIGDLIHKYEKAQVAQSLKDKSFSIKSVGNKKTISHNGSFSEFMSHEIKANKLLTPKTKLSHSNTLNHLLKFTKQSDIKFEDINYAFLDKFLNYLREKKKAVNTIHKQHKNFKKYIELAINKEYYDEPNPCKKLIVKTEQKKRDVLTIEEIRAIEKVDLSKLEEKVNNVRDLFLFSCYTGLRISDVTNLRTDYIKHTKEGYELDFVTIKVNKQAEIPLHSMFKVEGEKLSAPEIILEKYYNKNADFLFPRLTEQFINRHLKVIATLANIPFKLTFHSGRHSFGTYMASKIPLPQLMYLMQHSDIKTTMVYVNTNQEMVKQGLLKVDWK